MRMIFMDLVLDDGNLVRIECPVKFEDELYESLESAMKCRDAWAPGRFEGCTATFLGHRLDRVHMTRVVGRM